MSQELRKSGIDVVGDIPWGAHFCHFYETKQDLLDTLVPYFKAGLESKEFCLWVVSDSDLITVEEAKGALAQAVPDLDRHLAEENIEILRRHDWYFEENVLNLERVMSAWDAKLKQALTRGYAGLRASADTFWLREKDWKDFSDYEKQVDDWITDQSMTVLCTYPLAKSGAAELLDVVHAHQFAIARRQGEWEVIETPELRQAKAEIKRLNQELEQRVVERTSQLAKAIEKLTDEISDRKQSEVELSLAHQCLSYHVENTPLAVIEWDKDLFIKRWSKRAEEVFGWTESEALGINMCDRNFPIVYEEDVRAVAEISRQLMKGIVDRNLGLNRNYTKDGRVIYCEWYNSILRDEHGKVITILSLVHDVSERKHAEMLLHAREQEFRAIVENAPDQIIRYDREFRRTYVNPAVVRAYGLSADALVGKPIGSVIQDAGFGIKDDELAKVRQRIAAVFETGRSDESELSWQTPTGRKHYSVRLFPELDLHGSVVNVLGISRDITERKQAEDALRRSEDRIRLIIDTIPTMAWSILPDGTVDFANQRWLDYAGERGIENPNRIVHPEDLPRGMEKWLAAMAAGEPSEDELRLRRADGQYRWFMVRTAPLRDEQGNLVKWYGVSIDIEERKRAEALLFAKEQEFRAIVENAPDLIARYDRSFHRTYVNPAFSKSYDLATEDLIGKPMFSIIRDAGLDVKEEELTQIRQGFAAVFATGKTYEFEITLPLPTDRRDYSVRVFPEYDLNGSVINVLSIARDITASKHAEEELKKEKEVLEKIVDNIPVMIGFVGEDGRVKLVNSEWERTIGWTLKELEGQNVDIFAETYPDLQERQKFLDLVAASTGEWVDFKVKVRAGRMINAACAVVQLSDGTKIAIAQDITDRKSAEERISATSEQLRALSARLQSAREEEGTRIAREIHDELGSVLTSLKWDLEGTDRILAGPMEAAQIVALRERLHALTAQTDLAVSAIRRIASELRPSVLDDLGLAAAIEWQAQQFQTRTGIVCDCDCALENVELGEEQATAVFRILQEALTNVLRHAQATRVNIKINEENRHFSLSISDNGKGITESEKAEQQSLGILGMRERAHLIGGEIDIKGVEGKGTVVIVRVPISGQVLKLTG